MMHLRLPVLVALLAFLSAGCVVEAQNEGVDGSFERTIPLTGDAEVSVTSRSGNIRVVAGASDQVRISARIRAFGNFETRSGDVTLRVPPASPFDVDIETRSGSIRTSRAMESTGTFRGKGFRGSVGSGGPSIFVDTRSGSIEIE